MKTPPSDFYETDFYVFIISAETKNHCKSFRVNANVLYFDKWVL